MLTTSVALGCFVPNKQVTQLIKIIDEFDKKKALVDLLETVMDGSKGDLICLALSFSFAFIFLLATEFLLTLPELDDDENF